METYFSIYKIDVDFVWNEVLNKNQVSNSSTIDLNLMIESLLSIIRKRALTDVGNDNDFEVLSNDMDQVLIYRKKNKPPWLSTILGNFENNKEINLVFLNQNISYVLLSIIGEDVYASTGGHASNYLTKFIVRNFGLNIMTKLFQEDDPVIMQLIENKMLGSRQSQSVVNRIFTHFSFEKDYDKIFKRIHAKSGYNIAKKLGILESDAVEENYKSFSIISTDALNIRKRLTIEEHKELLRKIKKINDNESNFALSYFVSASNYGISGSMALDALCKQIIADETIVDEFSIVSDHHLEFHSASQWSIYKSNDLVKTITEMPPTFSQIYHDLFKEDLGNRKVTLTNLKKFFKEWSIRVNEDDPNNLLEIDQILNGIDYHFDYNFELDGEKYGKNGKIVRNMTVYLNSGSWYVLDTNYLDFINENYSKLYNKDSELIKNLYKKYDLNRFFENESKYNDSFKNKRIENVVLADQVLMYQIEICDLIVFDENETYLICNKKEPTGSQCRDLLNQVNSSASLINRDNEIIEKYYDKLVRKGRLDPIKLNKESFIQKIKKANYISSYITSDLSVGSQSLYGKLLSNQTDKALRSEGFRFYVTSPRRYI